jgi:hypothetical protein
LILRKLAAIPEHRAGRDHGGHEEDHPKDVVRDHTRHVSGEVRSSHRGETEGESVPPDDGVLHGVRDDGDEAHQHDGHERGGDRAVELDPGDACQEQHGEDRRASPEDGRSDPDDKTERCYQVHRHTAASRHIARGSRHQHPPDRLRRQARGALRRMRDHRGDQPLPGDPRRAAARERAFLRTGPREAIFHALSGTQVRELLRAGKLPPPEFSRPEVAQILLSATQERGHDQAA